MEELTDKDYYTLPGLVSEKNIFKKQIEQLKIEKTNRSNIALEDYNKLLANQRPSNLPVD